MEDWKKRLKEEYAQLKERYEKLKAYNNAIEIQEQLGKVFVHEPGRDEARKHDVRAGLMREQQSAMGHYLHILELRMELENIDP